MLFVQGANENTNLQIINTIYWPTRVGVYSTTKLSGVPASIIFGTKRLLSGPKHVNAQNHNDVIKIIL